MLMILEITNAVRNEFPMPWFKNYDKTIINSKHLSSRNSDMGKTFFLSEDIDNEDYDENGNELRDLNRSARDSMRVNIFIFNFYYSTFQFQSKVINVNE